MAGDDVGSSRASGDNQNSAPGGRGGEGKPRKPNYNRGSNGRGNSKRGGGTVVEREGAVKREDRAKALHTHKVDMRKYDKMIFAAHDNFADIVSTGSGLEDCTICCKSGDLFGIGRCRHPVCMECAIRMRILAEIPTCPVCRGNVDTLYFTFAGSGLSTVPLDFPRSNHPDEERFNIRFENEAAGCRYEKYLAHVCKICKSTDGERMEFATFISLRQHMAQTHQLSYCHICTDNLSLFSRERKTYTRDQLSRHIRNGDPDDKSQKGHPSCLFCDQRFFDEEGRYRHLRKEHFYCQFCEAEGTACNVFYGKHQELVAHYGEHHYLCDVPECKEMGIAYANQIDLKIHKSKEHGGNRQGLALDFQFSDRQLGRGGSRLVRGGRGDIRGRGDSSRVPREAVAPVAPPREERDTFVVVPSANYSGPVRYSRRPAYDVSSNQEQFPTLGGTSGSSAPAQVALNPNSFPRLDKVGKSKIASKGPPKREEFPTLGGNSSQASSQQRTANEQWSKHSGGFQVIDEDERIGASSSARGPAPPQLQVVKSAPSSARPVHHIPAKKNDLVTPRVTEAFPSLPAPAPANNPHINKGFNWNGKQHSNGQITGVMVPSGYSAASGSTRHPSGLITRPANSNQGQSKNKKKKNKKFGDNGPPPSPPPYSEPVEPEWEDVPFVAKKQKGRKGKHVEKPCIVGAIVPDNFGGRRPSTSSEDAHSSDDEPQQKKNDSKKTSGICKVSEGSGKNLIVKDSTTKTQQPMPMQQKKKFGTQKQQSDLEPTENFPSLGGSLVETPPQGGSILGGLFSFTGMLSSITSGWSSTTPVGSETSTDVPVKAADRLKTTQKTFPSSPAMNPASASMAAPSTLMMGPPPGFEGFAPKGTPESPSVRAPSLFDSVPMLTAEDIQKSKEAAAAMKVDPEGWATIPKKAPVKKNNKKK